MASEKLPILNEKQLTALAYNQGSEIEELKTIYSPAIVMQHVEELQSRSDETTEEVRELKAVIKKLRESWIQDVSDEQLKDARAKSGKSLKQVGKRFHLGDQGAHSLVTGKILNARKRHECLLFLLED